MTIENNITNIECIGIADNEWIRTLGRPVSDFKSLV